MRRQLARLGRIAPSIAVPVSRAGSSTAKKAGVARS